MMTLVGGGLRVPKVLERGGVDRSPGTLTQWSVGQGNDAHMHRVGLLLYVALISGELLNSSHLDCVSRESRNSLEVLVLGLSQSAQGIVLVKIFQPLNKGAVDIFASNLT